MNRLQILIQRYLDDNASDADVSEMLHLIRNKPAEEVQALLQAGLMGRTDPAEVQVDWQAMWAAIELEIAGDKKQPAPVHKIYPIKRWLSVAAALLVVVTGSYLLLTQQQKAGTTASATLPIQQDLPPGTTGAILTLPDGRTIVLDTASNGLLAASSGASISKGAGGVTVAAGNEKEMAYATLTTPMGRTQNVTLSDGTRIWLNAGSSIYFPTAFAGNERRVKITGEVYFEVAENAASPFRVTVGDAVVEVLGTHFNINAYADEKFTRTTLLSGSVKIIKGNAGGLLKPGQQASFMPGAQGISVKDDADALNSIAWVRGVFYFEDADIYTVMRQLARWYDVEIQYHGAVTNDRFGGDIQRNLPLSGVLKTLEKSQVHFKIDGKKLIVMP